MRFSSVAVDDLAGGEMAVAHLLSVGRQRIAFVGGPEKIRQEAARPDAIFAANDLLAVGVLQGLMLMGGVRVPEEIALIGYDDIEFAAAAVVPLSSIRQPSALFGSTALELLLRDASQESGFVPRQVVFPPELVVRASTQA